MKCGTSNETTNPRRRNCNLPLPPYCPRRTKRHLSSSKLGISLKNSTLYCRMTPCRTCAMLIINCGIKRVVCEKKYHAGKESEEMFALCNVELVFLCEDILQYDKQ